MAIALEAGIGAGIQINVDPNLDLPKERLEPNAEAKVTVSRPFTFRW